MNFRSNSEMARYYIEKLMEDGEEHSFPEITDYVMANSEGREIKGPLTIPIISNSVTKVICQGKVPTRQQNEAVIERSMLK
ncbi:MAG: hypothetical protein ACLR7G_11225 [[Clostridium] symbiosum]